MFGTSGVRGPVGEVVTADLALAIGRALAADGADRIVVGRDARTTGSFLADALSAGARECGVDVERLGVVPTPTVARSVGWRDADAGVVITASHNPPPDNGIKLWTPSGQAFGDDATDRIEALIRDDITATAAWDAVGHERTWDRAIDHHRDAIVEAVDDDLADCSVIVDVGNGTGRLTADVLADLGCSVETINAQPDGRFPGRLSEPTAEHCGTLARTVERTDADLGIAHDGDADRMMAVTDDGAFVTGDVLLALFARDAASDGGRIAAPVNTSLAVDDALDAVGASVTRTRVGDGYVAERASEPDVVFGGEPSGAWIWPDETPCPDGPLAACRLAAMVARAGPFSELVAGVETYPLRRESVRTDRKVAVMERVTTLVADRYDGEVDDRDGVRVGFDDGWLLIRPSGTEPLVRLTAEARDEGRADELVESARTLVEEAQQAVGSR